MAVSGKKINELDEVTTLTEDSVLPVVVINNGIPESTAKKATISQIIESLPSSSVTSVNTKTGDVVLTGEDIKIDSLSNTTITSALDDKQDTANIITDTTSSSITISELEYNTIYQYGTIDSLTISTLPSGYASSRDRYIETVIYFTSGVSGTTISLPTGLSWISGAAPTIQGNKKYVISICNGAVISGEF